MGDLDPQVKTLLEQFQAKVGQHSAPATPRSAMEKVCCVTTEGERLCCARHCFRSGLKS